MKDITKTYSNGEVTIVWKPAVCIHSRICWDKVNGLPQVFNPAVKPWITPTAAPTDALIAQVKKCPSAALTYFMNEAEAATPAEESDCVVEVSPAGPLLVHGNILVKDKEGMETTKNNVTAFCRCGASGNKPYCDGSHRKSGFKD